MTVVASADIHSVTDPADGVNETERFSEHKSLDARDLDAVNWRRSVLRNTAVLVQQRRANCGKG